MRRAGHSYGGRMPGSYAQASKDDLVSPGVIPSATGGLRPESRFVTCIGG